MSEFGAQIVSVAPNASLRRVNARAPPAQNKTSDERQFCARVVDAP
jgi:hypothetical protein